MPTLVVDVEDTAQDPTENGEFRNERDNDQADAGRLGHLARERRWRAFNNEYSGVTVHMDWYRNDRGDHVLAVEDDATRYVFDMIETDHSSPAASVELPDSVQEQLDTPAPILEVITEHGSEFVNPRQDDRPELDHEFEGYLHENDIKHSLGKVGRPQSNGKIERFYQTYEKHRWRLGTLE